MTSREKILVTGAGGAAGISVIRSLLRMGHSVIGADRDPMAAGLALADAAVVLPGYATPEFVSELVRQARHHRATCLVSTLAEEMAILADSSDVLTEAGLRHWLPEPETVGNCVDKWRFAQVVLDAGIPAPATGLASAAGVPGPWIVKPRFGRGSRDVYPVDSTGELAWALDRVPEPIVQSRLSGREFTVDALVGRDGRMAGAVPRWRLETKAGISTKGETFACTMLTKRTGELLDALRLRGPANVQGFVSADGDISFVEVNPRFSGGLPLSLAAGADLVGEYLMGLLGRPVRPEHLTFRAGVVMTRYFEEIFTWGAGTDPVHNDGITSG